jgi:hypothetical protein
MIFFLCYYFFKNGFAYFKNIPHELNNTWKIKGISLLAGLLFALHPVHTESVAWISGRTDLLATFFFLLAFISFLTYEKEGRQISLFLSCFFFSAPCSARKMRFLILV